MNKLLSPYLRRLRLNAALRALAGGFAVGLCAEASVLLACHLFLKEPISLRVLALAALILSLISAAMLYALPYRPTPLQAAKQLDALGLKERVSTMLALQESKAYLHTVQREDTRRALSAIGPETLQIRAPKAQVLICITALAACLIIGFLPWGALAPAQTVKVRTSEQDTLVQMLLNMRRRVEESDLSDAEKAELLSRIEELEASVDLGGGSMLQLLAQAEKTEERVVQEIAKTLDEKAATDLPQTGEQASVLSCLTEYPVLRELCQAILAMDGSGVRRACNALTTRILTPTGEARRSAVMDLYGYLNAVLIKSKDRDTDAYLIPILRLLAGELLGAAQADVSDELCAAQVAEALRAFAANLCNSFADTQTAQAQEDEEKSAEGKDAAGEEQAGEGESGKRSAGGGESSGRMSFGDGYMTYGGKGVSGLPITQGAAADDSEPMYEPTHGGQIPYGSMYGVYYAHMLELLTRDDSLPEDARSALELYFSGL